MTGKALLGALAVALLAVLPAPVPVAAEPPAGSVAPGERERCPVCGMFVAKFPAWAAQVRFADGRREVFDGAKDLFRYLADPAGHGGPPGQREVAAVLVTDYYSLEPVDGRRAFYVAGSDVLGPMGRELIPFARREEAEEFQRDHRGRKVVDFEEALRELENLVE